MIRRRWGKHFRLFNQQDHARLSGWFAERLAPPYGELPREVILATALHDEGWPEHDGRPTLNAVGEPRSFLETTPEIGLPTWTRSAERAAAADPYAGLLVALHSMWLGNLAAKATDDSETFDLSSRRVQFELLQFQHHMAELQATLRGRLGLRTDRPLLHGLAHGWSDPQEERLRCHFHLLQALDKLSLDVCCETVLNPTIEPVERGCGGPTESWKVQRPTARRLTLTPWPFVEPTLDAAVPYRAVPARTYLAPEDLHDALEDAPVETLNVALQPH